MDWKKKIQIKKNSIIESYNRLTANEHTGEQLFLLGLAAYLAISMWATTMFPLTALVSKIFKLSFLALVGLKILLYDHYHMKPLVAIALAGACMVLALYFSSYAIILVCLVMVAGSKDVSFEKILQTYLLIIGGIMLLAFVASLLGVIENLQYETTSRGIRNSFGIVYTTDFAAHVFYLILTFFYLKGENLRYYHYILTLGICGLVYYFCNARLDSASIALVVLLFALGNGILHAKHMGRRLKILWTHLWEQAGPLVVPAMAAFAILITATFHEGNALLDAFEKESGRRIGMGKEAMDEYGIKLFGQYIEMVGNGGTTERHGSEYFFLDCSYVNIFMRFGVIVMVLTALVYLLACLKNRHDQYFLYAVALLAFNSLIAHHMLEVEYNPFTLAFLATCVRKPAAETDWPKAKGGLWPEGRLKVKGRLWPEERLKAKGGL
ncbi:MAG: hypothetical protein HFG64_12120 [Lachnospiraceae bacterium]|nr:hypothetical protein [Lachnospiraceae bacterium]